MNGKKPAGKAPSGFCALSGFRGAKATPGRGRSWRSGARRRRRSCGGRVDREGRRLSSGDADWSERAEAVGGSAGRGRPRRACPAGVGLANGWRMAGEWADGVGWLAPGWTGSGRHDPGCAAFRRPQCGHSGPADPGRDAQTESSLIRAYRAASGWGRRTAAARPQRLAPSAPSGTPRALDACGRIAPPQGPARRQPPAHR